MEAAQDPMARVMAELQKKMQSYQSSKTTIQPITVKTYECDVCKDEGGLLVTKKAGTETIYRDFDGTFKKTVLKSDAQEWEECECVKLKRLNRLIKSSEITEEFQKMGFKNFDVEGVSEQVKSMRDVVLNYYKCFHDVRNMRVNSCLLIGQSGSGKTHLLTAVSNGLIREHRVPVLYFPFLDGMGNISADDWARKNEIVQKMKEVDVLFIDDLFKPVGTVAKIIDWQVKIVIEVLNHRYLNNMPMLISTELGLERLIDIDEAMASRMFEMASDFTITIDKNLSNNYRLRKLYEGA